MKPHFFITDIKEISREISKTPKQTFRSWDYPGEVFEVPNSEIIDETVKFEITLKSSGDTFDINIADIMLSVYTAINRTYHPY